MDQCKNRSRRFWALIAPFLSVFIVACAGVQVNTLPAPPPSAKLRVYIQAFSTSDIFPEVWRTSHQEFAQAMIRGTARILQQKGIYEVVSQEDVNAALGGRQRFMKADWTKNEWALTRSVGGALHAEYALFVERSLLQKVHHTEMILINTETGKKYRVLVRAPGGPGMNVQEYRYMTRIFHQELFRSAREDMLATAIRKGRLKSPEPPTPMISKPGFPPGSGAPKVPRTPAPFPPAKPLPAEKPPAMAKGPSPGTPPFPSPGASSSVMVESHVDLGKALLEEAQVEGHKRLAVYDLDAVEPYKIVALILSEALREELLRLRLFKMVNRENIVKILDEMAMQQMGVVDEKMAVKAGKGLAVQQIVLGRFGALGNLSVLQVKRLDVESQSDLAIASLKCESGREEELLHQMAALAKSISREK